MKQKEHELNPADYNNFQTAFISPSRLFSSNSCIYKLRTVALVTITQHFLPLT